MSATPLPPPGSSDSDAIVEFIDLLVVESSQDDRRQAFELAAERAMELYLGQHFKTVTPKGHIRITLNRIQNAVCAIHAIQAADPPKTEFLPRESGEPPITYLNIDIPAGQQLGLELVGAGMLTDPIQPLEPQIVEQIRMRIDQEQFAASQAMAMGIAAPPITITDDVLVEVTDQTAASALQTIYDAMDEESNAPFYYAENILNKNVSGWQPTLYEFDDFLKKHVLTNPHALAVFVDPLHTDTTRSQYVIYDQAMWAPEAKKKYPDLDAKKIDAWAESGPIQRIGAMGYTRPATYEQQFQRGMVLVRTAWIRCQPYPMSKQQAVRAGSLEERDIPTGQTELEMDDQLLPVLDHVTGLPIEKPITRPGLFAGEEEITDDVAHPKWPMRWGVREITIVAGELVNDKECEHANIPMPCNRNVPIPYSPYGQGEPERLEGVQMAINRLLSNFVTHQAYNAFPPEMISQALHARMGEAVQDARTAPGQRIVVPQEVMQTIGNDLKNAIVTLDVPTLPTDFWRLLDLLLGLIDKEANQAEVLQGNAESNWSGETVKSLQNAASQIIRGKSMYTEFYLKELARLKAHSIIHRMTVADWSKYLSGKPWQAIEALHNRNKSLECDISVSISSGSGAAKQSETNTLIAAKQGGVLISDPEIMERLGVDPKVQVKKQADYMKLVAQLQSPALPQPAGAAPGQAGQPQPNPQQPAA